MIVTNEQLWKKCQDNNQNGYGKTINDFAERWANEMEVHLSPLVSDLQIAEALDQRARDCERIADIEGITGFMYGAAVSTLAGVWKYGEHLRRWHNKKTQIGTEGDEANESGGTLNPALPSIG
jgi:hypothetical protein